MNILAVGDVVGKVGLQKLKEVLPSLIKEEKIDFVIVNGENVADGVGITEKMYKEMLSCGADVITMGNHTWGKKEIFNFIEDKPIIRPANYSDNVPGKGYEIYEVSSKKVCVINLIGRTAMSVLSDNPFTEAERIIEKVKGKADIIVVDFHAEASAEKVAMSYFLDGKVQILFGTHTHVQTADGAIMENGTAYITDIGMTGPKNSVIGMDIEASVKRFLTSLPEKYKTADGPAKFNSCLFKIDDKTNKAVEIRTINR